MNKADATNVKRNSQRVASRRRRPDKKTRSQEKFVTTTSLHGHRLNIPSDPPCIIQNPWTPITVHFLWRLGTDSTTGLINVSDVSSRLKQQLDSNTDEARKIFKNFYVYMRIHSICCWNLTGKSVGLAVWDYSSDSQDEDELGSWVDAGNSAGFPHIGYQWPMSLRVNSLSNADTNQSRRICTIVSGSREEVLVHIKLHYRFITPTSNPLLGLNALSLIASQQAETLKAMKAQNKISTSIYEQMPGRTITPTGMASNVFVGGFIPLAGSEVVPEGEHPNLITERLNAFHIGSNSDGFSVPDAAEFN